MSVRSIPLTERPDSVMVLQALDVAFPHRWWPHPATRRVFVMSYFAEDQPAFAAMLRAWAGDEYHGGVGYPLDFTLAPWITQGRVQWLDPTDPTMPLRDGTTAAFPTIWR